MKLSHMLLASAAALLAAPVLAQTPSVSAAEQDKLDAVADQALQSDAYAWDFVEGLTTEVGPRQSGTAAEQRARDWAKKWLTAQGFANVREEPFMMKTWVRGVEKAEVVSPFPQPLTLVALGNSAATPADGITAQVVGFDSYAALEAAPAGSLKGKIAFISHHMKRTQDGSGYGFAGPVRWTGPGLAASKGAVAAVIRSVGTDNHRTPHTGGTSFPDGVAPIPAAALSNPDADNLARMLERSDDVKLHLVLTPRNLGETKSGNVTAEIVGRDPSLPPVLLACHLDSWDLGTGAIDDGAGCAIIAAAAQHVAEAGQPLRTIRVLFAGAEETGVWGGKAYAKAHAKEPIAVGLESDFGADRIWQIRTNFAAGNEALHKALIQAVERFGVEGSTAIADNGEDLTIIHDQKTGHVDLAQDGTHYFDLHHTPDDTLDKIDPVQLRQNVAVWTQVVGLLSNEAGPIKPD
ncbi:M20/M25/M40 family metallo-hydrolase [Altererythrobacter indicus]|uniref:Carboxypeptidase Q n=1 Tax=Altericroceibacterium indicum TaxID=374177 RepID=A0A845AF94_9SPHN|nr:M20/M25/M40 family metallo-hydrolase [Altericroceibacterium indicum]MXP25828.1 M20/M25/M40 family metallo-hydrolase [Altericroceibacterium indicum]